MTLYRRGVIACGTLSCWSICWWGRLQTPIEA